jgi:DNA-binding Lrp family transcriptional regulator
MSAARAPPVTHGQALSRGMETRTPATERGRQGRRPTMSGVITAIVMVSVQTDRIPEVAQEIADLSGVSEVYSVAGDVDLIAVVRVREFEQIAEVIAGRISKVSGVLHTDTHIAFRAYSRHDLESAFAIGFQSAD